MARLTIRQFVMYLEESAHLKREEYRMELAVATNPHAKSADQKRLWDVLRQKPKGGPRELTDDELLSRKKLEAELAEKRKKRGI